MTKALTTEEIRKKFKNNFDLCNFSIDIARNILMGGTSPTLAELLRIIDQKASEIGKN